MNGVKSLNIKPHKHYTNKGIASLMAEKLNLRVWKLEVPYFFKFVVLLLNREFRLHLKLHISIICNFIKL
jgi:hypothetical protein